MKTIKITIGLLVFITIGCGSEHHTKVHELTPVVVKVAKASYSNNGSVISASGKIEAKRSANLSTRMMGHVEKLHVKVGEQVKRGTLLLSIHSDDLLAKRAQVEANIIQAESGYKNAEKDFERFKSLYEKGSASEKELENMTTRYESAKAGLKAAKEMKKEVESHFAYANIKAPFDGVVINTFLKPGDMANPGMPLVTIEGNQFYEAVVLVPESEILNIKETTKASVLIKSIDQQFEGEVIEVSKSAKNTGGQFLVKVAIPEALNVLPGMFANVKLFNSDNSDKTLLIPEKVLVRKGQLTGIYTVDDSKNAILRWLRVGKSTDGMIEVLSGLSEGETYVSSAEGKLFNGAKLSY